MLEGIVADPDQRLSQLPILTDAERHDLLVAWNETHVDLAQERLISELFEAQVERSPEAVAVEFGLERLTYRELNARANQTAHYLRKLGVGPDVLVGLCVERSIEMVVGLLGILKAGGAYVPLDPAYPRERLALILEDARAPVLLTLQRLAGSLPETESEVVLLDADWPIIARESGENLAGLGEPGNLAYIIYTSGSTGVAKGVAMPHGPLLNLISWQIRLFVAAPSR